MPWDELKTNSTMLGTGPASSLGPAGFYESRRRQEQVYLNEIRRRFAAYPLTWIPQFETDVYGLENLERVRLGLMR